MITKKKGNTGENSYELELRIMKSDGLAKCTDISVSTIYGICYNILHTRLSVLTYLASGSLTTLL